MPLLMGELCGIRLGYSSPKISLCPEIVERVNALESIIIKFDIYYKVDYK